MTEERWQSLCAAGIQMDELLERLMGSHSLLERLLQKFLEDESYRLLYEAIEAGKEEEAFRAAHTLKGLCANLSMVALSEKVSRQVELLRGGADWEGAAVLMPGITEEYNRLRQAIQGEDSPHRQTP